MIRHGKGPGGQFLKCDWDRANGETVVMYVLGAGAEEARALPAASWASTRPFYGEVAGHQFNNADLGLFVFQYGLDLLDLAPLAVAQTDWIWHGRGFGGRPRSRIERLAWLRPIEFRTYRAIIGDFRPATAPSHAIRVHEAYR